MQTILRWNKDYELGIPIIDEQHKKLVSIINRMESYRNTENCAQNIDQIFLELVNYSNYHFTIEETAMEKSKYPRLQIHRASHDIFIQKIHEFNVKSKKDNCFSLTETINFLYDWLIDHIMVEDQNYVSSIRHLFVK